MANPARKQSDKQSPGKGQPPGPGGHMSPGDEAPPGTPGTGESLCRTCGGTGTLDGRPCHQCEGSGYVITGIGGA